MGMNARILTTATLFATLAGVLIAKAADSQMLSLVMPDAKVIGNPVILKALSPGYGFAFFLDHPLTGFLALGGIVLVVTGAEALYADLGQFDRPSITRGQET